MTSAAGVESKQRKLAVFKEPSSSIAMCATGVVPSAGVLKPLALTLSLDVLV